MDLKKLYGDVTVILGSEMPIYTFLTYCDLCARTLICRYPKKLVLPCGEYVSPSALCDSLSLDSAFYGAILLYIAGKAKNDADMLNKSDKAAQEAYLSLWKKAARGKRLVSDRW